MPGKTLLVVEDDVDIRESLVEFLTDEGFRVFSSCNGKEAWDALPSIPRPSVILLDLQMPEMTGRELFEKLRADPRYDSIPVAILTAANDRQVPEKVDGFIRKPLDLDDLLRTIERISR